MKLLEWMKVGAVLMMASPLGAVPPGPLKSDAAQDSARSKKHQTKFDEMQVDRKKDDEHTRVASEELHDSQATLSNQDSQQLKDIQGLRSADRKVEAGELQRDEKRESYKEAKRTYGSEDPRSAQAKANWQKSRDKLVPLQEDQTQRREDVKDGRRVVQNQKVVVGVQKRMMDSDARYRASDDREFKKAEKAVAEDRETAIKTGSPIQNNK